MVTLENSIDESKRLEALNRYNLLDTPSDGSFDKITALASLIFKVPISIISLVDTDRIWFKSHHGISVKQIGRDPGLCASAILSHDIYIVENAKDDPRTLANPLVAGEFGLRFYAAAPLHTEDNFNLGTLCIIDKEPRTFSASDKEILKKLGDIVMGEMDMRLAVRETAINLKNMAHDLDNHLKHTMVNLKNGSSPDIIPQIEASRTYIRNLANHLNNI